MRNKRDVVLSRSGQVTVFIILGIIIFATVGIILYLKYSYVEDIPTTFELSNEPVERYIQSCIIDITEEAILKAGQQGGYIYVEELSETEKELIELMPFNADYFLLGKQQLPYWYYQKNDGFDRVEIPQLDMQYIGDDSIQDQIERYITERLPVCLANFAPLKTTGINVNYAGEYLIESRVGDESIEVTALLPITIEEDSTITEMDEFLIIVPTGLKRTYELAVEIAEHELDTLFLEQNTRNLISIYGQADKNYLPPMAGGLHFEACENREYWFYNSANEDMRDMLAANIPYLQVANTEYTAIEITSAMTPNAEQQERRQAMMDKFLVTPSNNEYEGITTSFQYQTTYPMELVYGNNIGYGLIQPNVLEINILVANFCMFDYSFLYNVKYPVLVTLVDATTDINGNAFIFQFPLQVVIKNNYPRIKLNDALRDTYDIPETAIGDPTWQCDPQQRLSDESTVTIQNPSNEPVENAVVTFQCGPSYVYDYNENDTIEAVIPFAKTCYMGTTNSDGKLTTTYPPCTGAGFVTVQHEDHVEKSASTPDITQGTSFEQTVILDKIYTMEADVQKFFTPGPSETNEEGIGIHLDENGEITACNANLDPKQLQSYESAIISITKLDVQNGIMNSVPIVVFDPNNEEPTTIDIAAGSYAVDIILMREERYPGEMTIEANSQSIEITSTTGSDYISYPEEDVLIEQTFTGGAVFVWDVTDTQLASGTTILFSVFDEGMPTMVEEIGAPLQHREICSALEYKVIQPRIS